jgi:hypothetical protein
MERNSSPRRISSSGFRKVEIIVAQGSGMNQLSRVRNVRHLKWIDCLRTKFSKTLLGIFQKTRSIRAKFLEHSSRRFNQAIACQNDWSAIFENIAQLLKGQTRRFGFYSDCAHAGVTINGDFAFVWQCHCHSRANNVLVALKVLQICPLLNF